MQNCAPVQLWLSSMAWSVASGEPCAGSVGRQEKGQDPCAKGSMGPADDDGAAQQTAGLRAADCAALTKHTAVSTGVRLSTCVQGEAGSHDVKRCGCAEWGYRLAQRAKASCSTYMHFRSGGRTSPRSLLYDVTLESCPMSTRSSLSKAASQSACMAKSCTAMPFRHPVIKT